MAEASHLRVPGPLSFDGNVAEEWRKFEQDFRIYAKAVLKRKDPDEVAYTLLNLAGHEAIEREKTFLYQEEIRDNGNIVQHAENREDPEILMRKFREHCNPKKNIIVQRHLFWTRQQRQGETYEAFIADLRKMAADCDYGQLRDELIRDKIVCGIQSDPLRKQMLKEEDLTLARAVQLCMLEESTKRNLAQMSEKTKESVDALATSKRPPASRRDMQHQSPQQPSSTCRNCGGSHPRVKHKCSAYGKQCNKCGKYNHFARLCLSTPSPVKVFHAKQTTAKFKPQRQNVHHVATTSDNDENSDSIVIDTITTVDEIATCRKEAFVTLTINKQKVELKVDTGAKCNVLPASLVNQKDINTNSTIKLVAYGGDTFSTMGIANFKCHHRGQQLALQFHVVDRDVTPIIGLPDALRLNLIQLAAEVHQLQDNDPPEVTSFPDLFDEKLGKLPVIYKMKVNPDVTPVVRPPRRIPMTMKEPVKQALDKMANQGVIIPVEEPTEWVSSMVAAVKKNTKDIRICIDPRDLNKALQRPHHPMRTIDDVIADMPNAKVFTTLDAKSGFWQIPLDHESSMKTCFNTPFGRYRFLRMPFGISTASEVFQRSMEQLFAGYPCEIIVDDILIWGTNTEDHDQKLRQVLQRAHEINLKLNKAKCHFRVDKVSYMGHTISAQGLHPDPEKVRAVQELPTPNNKEDLQRFLGMINYLSRFVPNFSAETYPLRDLLRNDSEWCWLQQHADAFATLKKRISHPPVLRFFDVNKQVTITCDASKSGLGAACLQDGVPIAYASRAMTSTEERYSQIEKELLAASFACSKFDGFIYGKPVTLETDHQPLVTIMKKPLHAAPTRLQRMLLKLQRYHLHVVYKKGSELYIADALSRAYLPETLNEPEEDYEVMSVLPLTTTAMLQLQQATASDPTCQQLRCTLEHGWPSSYKHVPDNIKPFYAFRDEIGYEDGVLMKGQRIIVPLPLQHHYATKLHQGHPGIEGTKARAREIAYWPDIMQDIEAEVAHCKSCNAMKPRQTKEPLLPREAPDLPFQTVAADIFTWNGYNYLVTVDAYSGWFDINKLPNTTSRSVIDKLKRHFSTHGIPATLLTDNAMQFKSHEFAQFASEWQFSHVTSSPNYPQSNGLAERAVRSAKHLLEKCRRDQTDFFLALLHARNVPRGTLGSSAQRLLSRRTRTNLPISSKLLLPTTITNVKEKLSAQHSKLKQHYDKGSKTLMPLSPDQTVRIETSQGFDRVGRILRPADRPRSYIIESEGRIIERNRRHLRPAPEPFTQPDNDEDSASTPILPRNTASALPSATLTSCSSPGQRETPRSSPVSEAPSLRRSERVSKPNLKYKGGQWTV